MSHAHAIGFHQRIVRQLLPNPTNIRRVWVDNSTNPVTFWVGSNHGASIVKLEPLLPPPSFPGPPVHAECQRLAEEPEASSRPFAQSKLSAA